jgi:hypothetical protein
MCERRTRVGKVSEYASGLAEQQRRQLEVFIGMTATRARVQHLARTTGIAQSERLPPHMHASTHKV